MTDWHGRHVLVTGGTGFIGRHLTARLLEAGADVWVGVYPQEAAGRIAALSDRVKRVPLDIQDAQSALYAAGRAPFQVVFHLAAVGVTDPGIDPALALTVNAKGTVHLLAALRGRDVQRVVITGTSLEYGARETREGLDPINAYAASKVAAWAFGRMFWRAYGLPVVTARLFQVYGPGQLPPALVPATIRAALTGQDFAMTPGGQERDFVYVKDVVEGLLAAASAPDAEGQSLDLGTGTAQPIRQVVERAWLLARGTGEIRAGALPYRPGEIVHIVADADHTAALTGWRWRTGLDSGLRATIDELRRSLTR